MALTLLDVKKIRSALFKHYLIDKIISEAYYRRFDKVLHIIEREIFITIGGK